MKLNRTRGSFLALALAGIAACSGSSGTAQPGVTIAAAEVGPTPDKTPLAADTTTPPATTPAETTTTAAPGPRWATGTSDVLFDQSAFHTFEIDLTPEALAVLDENPTAEEYVEGSLTFDGETLSKVGVRYKGSVGGFMMCTSGGIGGGIPNPEGGASPLTPTGEKTCTKLSMKIKINWDEKNTTFYGVKRVQLHAVNGDPTMMHDRLGYYMFREMGVPAPRATHARVVVNGEFVGVFALVEQIGEEWAAENFDDPSGNIYKEIWPTNGAGDARTDDEMIKALENNTKKPDVSIMAALASEIAASPVEQHVEIVKRYIDVDAFLRYAVVDRAIEHEDGALHWYCFNAPDCSPHNFYWYEDPTARKLTLIPWDLDLAMDGFTGGFISQVIGIRDPFGETRNDCKPFTDGPFPMPQVSAACDPIVAALASLRDDFDRIRAELLAGPMTAENITAQLSEWTAQIEGAVAEASGLHDDAPKPDAWRTNVAKLRDGLIASLNGDGR